MKIDYICIDIKYKYTKSSSTKIVIIQLHAQI